MTLTDTRLSHGGCEKLELAIMSFLEQTRKIYINEHMQKLKVYKRLTEAMGNSDESMLLLSIISRKMYGNFMILIFNNFSCFLLSA
jgi:exportin-7